MKNELERIRDQLKCSLNMGGLKGSAEWAVGELDRLSTGLPVGVPDGFRVMKPTGAILSDGDRWEIYAPCGSGGIVHEDDVTDWVVRKLLDAMAAAPTVKAEQVRLPERKRTDHLPADYKTMTPTRAAIESYNRALDDVAALNAIPAPPPCRLLDRPWKRWRWWPAHSNAKTRFAFQLPTSCRKQTDILTS